MRFSANPARATLRQKMGRLPGPQRAMLNLLLAAALVLAGVALLTVLLVRVVVSEQAEQLGAAVAAEAAQRSAEFLVHNDLVSLTVITGSLSRMPGIVGVTIYDRHRQAIAQAGLTRGNPDTLLVSADIVTEEDELRGTVQLLVEPYAALPALDRFYYTLGGGVGFALVFLLFVARLQRDLLAGDGAPATATEPSAVDTHAGPAADAEETSTEEDPPPPDVLPPVTGPLLRISIVNLANLEARMAPHMLATLIDFYDEVLARAAAIYQGQIRQGLGQDCLIDFPGAGDEEETLFRAMCCAQLFFGVVRETNNARRAASRQTLQFKAALLHDPALDNDTRAALAWEICQHGSPGRLTVNDLVSDHPLLAERMVLDTGNRQLLQVEVPAFGETPASAQDVLVVPVVRLVSPYEELLGRQVSTLCGMAEVGA